MTGLHLKVVENCIISLKSKMTYHTVFFIISREDDLSSVIHRQTYTSSSVSFLLCLSLLFVFFPQQKSSTGTGEGREMEKERKGGREGEGEIEEYIGYTESTVKQCD